MTVTGRCHCGRVTIEVPSAPEWIGSCDCSFCTKTGWMLGYWPDDGSVRVDGATVPYVQGDRMLEQQHCGACGCATHWRPLVEGIGKVGVNARLLDGFRLASGLGEPPTLDGRPLEVRRLHNR